jgi:mannose-6-phosphate isomerase-like protein (cupin superfamily)
MQTRVHSHRGPEAFYVVEGQQCMETPIEKRLIAAGGTYVVKQGPHIQAAPKGRRNLVLILSPKGEPAVISGGDWQPSGFCKLPTQ